MSMKEVKKSIDDAAANLKEAAIETGKTIAEKTRDAAAYVEQKSDEAFHCAERKTKKLCRKTKCAAGDVKEKIVETGQSIADKTSDAATGAAKKTSNLCHRVTDR